MSSSSCDNQCSCATTKQGRGVPIDECLAEIKADEQSSSLVMETKKKDYGIAFLRGIPIEACLAAINADEHVIVSPNDSHDIWTHDVKGKSVLIFGTYFPKDSPAKLISAGATSVRVFLYSQSEKDYYNKEGLERLPLFDCSPCLVPDAYHWAYRIIDQSKPGCTDRITFFFRGLFFLYDERHQKQASLVDKFLWAMQESDKKGAAFAVKCVKVGGPIVKTNKKFAADIVAKNGKKISCGEYKNCRMVFAPLFPVVPLCKESAKDVDIAINVRHLISGKVAISCYTEKEEVELKFLQDPRYGFGGSDHMHGTTCDFGEFVFDPKVESLEEMLHRK